MERKSQRTDDFNGGIQNGTTASSEESIFLDRCLKIIRDELIVELAPLGYTLIKQMSRPLLESRGCFVGCAPDGGIWLKDGEFLAAFEAKKQGAGGNAIERHGKNVTVTKRFNKDIKYVTFARGEGVKRNNPIYKYAKTMLSEDWDTTGTRNFDTLYESGQSWFMNTHGFTKEYIKGIMRKAICGNI